MGLDAANPLAGRLLAPSPSGGRSCLVPTPPRTRDGGSGPSRVEVDALDDFLPGLPGKDGAERPDKADEDSFGAVKLFALWLMG